MDDTALPTLAAGTLLAERYRVLGHLGTGGMGAVYRVEHVMMAKQLALKLLRPELSSQASVVERFEREARSSARLDHPHVVRITDFGRQADGALYMVMELVEGPSLADVLRAGPRPGLDWSARVLDQILAALEHAPRPRRGAPPRHQAGQRHAHPRRAGEAGGLRHRQDHGHRRGAADAAGDGGGHAPLHGARASRRRGRGRARRPLLGGRAGL
jgi:serine/threonine protein kinase